MPKPRPTSVFVIAILQLVFGGLALLQSTCAGGLMARESPFLMKGTTPQSRWLEDLQPRMMKYIEERQPYARVSQYVVIGLGIGLSIAMIVSGIGLLKMQSWGRHLSILYAVLSLGEKIFGIIYALLVTIPIMQQFFDTLQPPGPMEKQMVDMMRLMMNVTPFIQIPFMVYPIVVLAIMLRSSVAAAFREPVASEYA